MNDLEQIRGQAVGQETDEELLRQYPVQEQRELDIPTRHGSVRAYLYRPFAREPQLPVLINFHGGGFVKGYRGRDVGFSHILAVRGACLVIDVDYKTAPEYRYPYAVEESVDLIRYFQGNVEAYGGDPARIVLSGQSAGANIITAAALMMNRDGLTLPRQLICCYPPYDLWSDPEEKTGAGREPERVRTGRLYNDWYVEEGRRKEIYASPVFARTEELQGLPPFVIIAAEQDTLCGEALHFAHMLLEAGVTVTAKKIAGAGHGFLVRRTAGYETAEKLLFAALREAFESER